MAFPFSGPAGNALSVALQIDGQVGSVLGSLQQWRADVNATGIISSDQVMSIYQTLTALLSYVNARSGVPGLGAAYQFLFPTIGAFNPGSEWTAARLAIEQFADWIAANWPEKSASGKLAFSQVMPDADRQLTKFSVNLAAPAKTALVARIDAVLAAFVTP